jgi:dTDP-glucose 4,6-dehydratase
MKILVTGGAGFIGSAFIRYVLATTDASVVNVDCLTYAANPRALEGADKGPRYAFERHDIVDGAAMREIVARHQPDAIIHLAAESHVDRSIDGPGSFIQTNLVGTYTMLEAAREYYGTLEGDTKARFRFHHVSTDEVFGSLGATGKFTEDSPYQPNSPYSATKAGSDHLVRAWFETFGLPVVISNCTNNYGPWQFPEKLIPTILVNALAGKPIPIYGTGENVRDWLYVDDHAEALWTILTRGQNGGSYNVGGDCERTNLEVAKAVCSCLDGMRPREDGTSYETLITFVTDRPGHDLRYAMDTSKIAAELGWQPRHDFTAGLEATLKWYLDHEAWWRKVMATVYDGRRQGLGR